MKSVHLMLVTAKIGLEKIFQVFECEYLISKNIV